MFMNCYILDNAILFKNSGECNQWLNISFCRKVIIALVLDTLIVTDHRLAQSDIDEV